MKFNPQLFDINSINNGERFVEGDGVTPDAINAPIEAAAMMQSLANNPPDVTDANVVGTPSVEIIANQGNPIFKFSNLKGEKGAPGLRGIQGEKGAQGPQGAKGDQGEKGDVGERGASYTDSALSNVWGDSDIDGYTQKAINGMVYRPNILINGNFKINQRGISSLVGSVDQIEDDFIADCWNYYGKGSISRIGNSLKWSPAIALDETLSQSIKCPIFNSETPLTLSFYGSGQQTLNIHIRIYSASNSVVWAQDFNDVDLDYNGKIISLTTRKLNYDAITKGYKLSISFTPKYIYSDDANDIYLSWIKLEEGSFPTQFISRPYQEELLLCQAYYQEYTYYNGVPIAMVVTPYAGSSNNDTGYGTIPLSTPVIGTPNIEMTGEIYAYKDSDRFSSARVVSISPVARSNNILQFGVYVDKSYFSDKTFCMLIPYGDAKFKFISDFA